MRLPAQVWCHYATGHPNVEVGHPGDFPPDPQRFNAIVNDHPHNRHDRKPFGGLWTSSWVPGRLCDWADFAGETLAHLWFKAWVLVPDADVRLFEIGSVEDVERLIAQYPWHCSCISCQAVDMTTEGMYPGPLSMTMRHPYDVEAMAADGWDGIHLTHQGQAATHLPDVSNFYRHQLVSFYGWDCESTLWFRWRFREVRYFGYWKYADPRPEALAAVRSVVEAAGKMTPELAAAFDSLAAELLET